ncbi:MAG TPA: LLM class flavin-dependent oxidoreductase [Acidimicrobiales bacterium]|nr:LLM class flavin-dependent oxidoreductase [Acidimicrobiales bacterium]
MGTRDAGEQVAFGFQLPVPGRAGLAGASEPRADAEELATVARVAERAGFAVLAVGDHVDLPGSAAPRAGPTWCDALATLSWLAAGTERVRLLGHLGGQPLRHPLLAAKQWAALDAGTGGRTVLGVGPGGTEGGPAALDVDGRHEGALVDEALEALRTTLDGERAAHEGRPSGPAGRRVPIWVGGASAAARQRAARWGDGWLAVGPPEGRLSVAVAQVHELRERYGRADEPFTVGALSGPLYVGAPRWDVGRAVHGSPEQIASFLRSIARLGVDQIQVTFRSRDVHELHDQLRAFGAEVAPLVAAGARRPVRSG